MKPSPAPLALLLTAVAASGGGAPRSCISVPVEVPESASQNVDPQFVGIAIESLNLPNYTDTYSQNLISVFSEKSGKPVMIRVGGTSMDQTIFDLSQEQAVTHPDGIAAGLNSNSTFGVAWFDSFKRMSNVQWIVQVALGRYNESNAWQFTQKCLDSMGGVESLWAVEIGNEIDNFVSFGLRNSSYSPAAYAEECKAYMHAISGNVTSLPKENIYQIWDKSSAGSNGPWDVLEFMGNVSQILDFGQLRQVARHYYQANAGQDLQNVLLNHSYTVQVSDSHFQQTVTYLRDNYPDIPLVVDEIGSAIGDSSSPIYPDLPLVGSLGTAIWVVDWLLYAMVSNITRINMQQGMDIQNRPEAFAGWWPTGMPNSTAPPSTQSSFYGYVFAADFLAGKSGLRVSSIATGSQNISAYAGYDAGGGLVNLALTNQQLWNATSGTVRPVQTIDIVVGEAKEVTVRRLTGPSGDATTNITWAGTQWPYSTLGKPVQIANDTQQIAVVGGIAEISIPATTAFMIDLIY